MAQEIVIDICSPPDRERLVAAILIDDRQWAEISHEHERFLIEVYPRMDGQPWVLEFDEAVDALQRAKAALSQWLR